MPPGCCYGRLDVPADADANAQAAAALRAALPACWAGWHSSRQRYAQLGQAVGDPPAGPWRIDARLDELDFGVWEGRAWDSIGRAALQAWVDDFAHHRPGGGESVAALLQRVLAALEEATRLHPAQDVVWITHAGVIRAVDWLSRQGGALRLPAAGDWPRQAPGWGQWVVRFWPPEPTAHAR